MKTKVEFPKIFLWGSATSSHQIEGGNLNNWSRWEAQSACSLAEGSKNIYEDWQRRKFPEMLRPENYISGKACDHRNRYKEDLEILEELNQKAYRFSIEWSRIEPEENIFNEEAVEYYRNILSELKKRGIRPMVTLWHWTIPLWLADKGGESSRKFPHYFSRYAKFIAEELGDLVDLWITLNEPTTVIANGYLNDKFPPGKKSIFSAVKAFRILAEAHNEAYEEIHNVRRNAKVSFSNYFVFYEALNETFPNKLVAKIARHLGHREFFNLTAKRLDFLGVQYYGKAIVEFPYKFIRKSEYAKEFDDLGWEIHPKGLYYILKKLKKYNLPIYITENGLADAEDNLREKFIKEHLYWISKAMQEGADVKGYFYWSLLDNFEWEKGFWPRFGLVEVDYGTLERKIRPSAYGYAKICRNGSFSIDEGTLL